MEQSPLVLNPLEGVTLAPDAPDAAVAPDALNGASKRASDKCRSSSNALTFHRFLRNANQNAERSEQ